MQTEAMEQNHVKRAPESVILRALEQAPVAPKELKAYVRQEFRELSDKQCKAALDALVLARKIHGLYALGKDGKWNKSVDRYAIGAPPSVREQILEILSSGELVPAKLKELVGSKVGPLSAKDFNAALAELVAERKVYGRRKRNAKGGLAKTVEAYSLGGPPIAEFIEPVLLAWKKALTDAAAVGIDGQSLAAQLSRALATEGINVASKPREDSGNDQKKVLQALRELVDRDGRGALIPLRRLRPAVALGKSRFDSALLELYAADAVILNHHDYVGSLSEAERAELLEDSHGNYYVGAALRGES